MECINKDAMTTRLVSLTRPQIESSWSGGVAWWPTWIRSSAWRTRPERKWNGGESIHDKWPRRSSTKNWTVRGISGQQQAHKRKVLNWSDRTVNCPGPRYMRHAFLSDSSGYCRCLRTLFLLRSLSRQVCGGDESVPIGWVPSLGCSEDICGRRNRVPSERPERRPKGWRWNSKLP